VETLAGPGVTASGTDAAAPQPRVLLHMPVDVRSASMALIAVLLAIYSLHWAAAVVIPLLLGLMFSYALSPVVNALERWRVPRSLGAALAVVAVVGALGWMVYSLADDATQLVESLPTAAQKLRHALKEQMGVSSKGTLDKVQQAAAQLEQAAAEGAGTASPGGARKVRQVQVVRPKFDVQEYLWSGGMGLVGFLGQALVVCLLTYFLMASGSAFRRKLVRVAGPTLSDKKITVEALDEITEQIQRYLLVQLLISGVVGVATWLALLWLGLQHPGVWGIAAAALNLIPYVGALALTAGAALFTLMQFGTLQMTLTVAGVTLGIHFVSGYLLTPWLTSRTSQLSPVAVFVGVLVWGWLWGVWGMLLGVPIIMIMKAACDRVESLKPIGEFLGP
jgi:predicted PurR-regulated permease PerM